MVTSFSFSFFKVYEYMAVPLPVPGHDDLHMTIRPEHSIIAVDSWRGAFVTMTEARLNACRIEGAYFVCKDLYQRHTRARATEFDGKVDDKLCVWFLYNNDRVNAEKACALHVHAPRSEVFVVSGTEFVIVEKNTQTVNLSCKGADPVPITVGAPTR